MSLVTWHFWTILHMVRNSASALEENRDILCFVVVFFFFKKISGVLVYRMTPKSSWGK